jgi:hypothetical protein
MKTNLGPAVPLGLVLVVGPAGLQHGLVNPAAAGHNAHHGPVGGGDYLLGARRQLHPAQHYHQNNLIYNSWARDQVTVIFLKQLIDPLLVYD